MNRRDHKLRSQAMCGSIYVTALAFILLGVLGCGRSGSSHVQKGMTLSLPDAPRVRVTAYFYPPSERTTELYEQRLQFKYRKIQELREQITKQPPYLQESSRQLIDYYEQEWRLLKHSVDWPVVFVERILLAEDRPSKYVAFLRKRNRSMDLVLIISSPEPVQETNAFQLVRSAISHFEGFSDEDWNKIKISSEPAFAPDGELKPDELQKAFEGSVFIGPPP